jgi:replicative DNA helicase
MEGGMAISTGLTDLDRLLGGGVFDGDLIVVGARPGMGKTTLLQNISNYIARTKGNVLFFSCEMDYNALSDRDIAGFVGVPINTVRLGKYDSQLYCDITSSLEILKETKLYIYDETPITTSKIMQASLNMKLRHGLVAIVIDYLGLLDDEVGENRNITLGYMTKKLKQVARKLNIPVILAHQLSRDLEKRDDKRPILSDLRESGHIEEDADGVLFLYRDSYYYDRVKWRQMYSNKKTGECPEYPENITEVIIAKQRQGESNISVKVLFDKKYQIFKDLYLG